MSDPTVIISEWLTKWESLTIYKIRLKAKGYLKKYNNLNYILEMFKEELEEWVTSFLIKDEYETIKRELLLLTLKNVNWENIAKVVLKNTDCTMYNIISKEINE